ncbi:cache domain-containing sensor histidine kinase [Cohnella phaseoli]|uniref:histidine kinase n=1 Tax=Cohnella phaseoli TaxID=456490 RepID=A0A3D9IXH5_9BACL|nr:sensor histidine kinase [Cohnella phaseoli]RED66421.1 HAMP domain-containing protein [Cohnella phaseoli]
MYKQIVSYTQKYRLSYRMILTNICIAILPILLLGFVGYFSYVHIMKQNALDNINQFVNQTNDRFEEYFSRVDLLAKSVFYNRNIQQVMLDNMSWRETDALLRNMSSYMSLDPTIKTVGMINADDYRIVSTGQLLSGEMIDYIRNKQQTGSINGKIKISPPMGSKEQGLLAFSQVKSIQRNRYLQGIYIGVLLLDTKWIQQILHTSGLDNKAIVYIVNENDDLIGASDGRHDFANIRTLVRDLPSNRVSDVRIENGNYLYQSIPIKSLDWKFIALIDKDKLLEKANIIPYALIAIVAVMMLIVFLAVVSFNIRLTHPITKMADAFDSAASGNLDAKLKFGYKNEITVIQDHYNNMLDQIKGLTDHLLQSQRQLHETEMDKQLYQLNGLQSQINAHFLYNVLHSIRGMSLSNAKREVAMAIDNLVSYFRYITRTDEFVLLYKELEHLERYIAIQKIRFGERLQFKVSLAPALGGQSIVKLILQPLVENALFHGLEEKSGRWIIRIKAVATEKDELQIKVMDNGLGMNESKAANLRSELERMSGASAGSGGFGQGIGLVNIHKRIRIYYGEPYGLSIKSWQNRGTIITITVPLRGGGDTDA